MAEAPETHLSPAEWRIMKIVWNRRRASAQDIVMDLAEHAPPHGYRQVHVSLQRMRAKGYVEVDDDKRPHYFSPRVDRATVVRDVARHFIEEGLQADARDLEILLEVVQERLSRRPDPES